MKTSKVDTWIKNILLTEEIEISCSDCFDLLSVYVDAELAHRPELVKYTKVGQHLVQCQVCREEYELLRDLAQMDASDGDIRPGE